MIPFAPKIAAANKGQAVDFSPEEEAALNTAAAAAEKIISESQNFTAEQLTAQATLLANAKGLAKVATALKKTEGEAITLSSIKQDFYLYEGADNSIYQGKYFTFECLDPDNIIVINKAGQVIWDDGSHDGAIYLLLNDNIDVSAKSAADIVADGKNFKQLSKMHLITLPQPDGRDVCVGEWIGSTKDLKIDLLNTINTNFEFVVF